MNHISQTAAIESKHRKQMKSNELAMSFKKFNLVALLIS